MNENEVYSEVVLAARMTRKKGFHWLGFGLHLKKQLVANTLIVNFLLKARLLDDVCIRTMYGL